MQAVSGVLLSSIRHDGVRESHDCSPFLRGLEMYRVFSRDWTGVGVHYRNTASLTMKY